MIHTFEIMHQIMSDGLYDFLMSFKGYGKNGFGDGAYHYLTRSITKNNTHPNCLEESGSVYNLDDVNKSTISLSAKHPCTGINRITVRRICSADHINKKSNTAVINIFFYVYLDINPRSMLDKEDVYTVDLYKAGQESNMALEQCFYEIMDGFLGSNFSDLKNIRRWKVKRVDYTFNFEFVKEDEFDIFYSLTHKTSKLLRTKRKKVPGEKEMEQSYAEGNGSYKTMFYDKRKEIETTYNQDDYRYLPLLSDSYNVCRFEHQAKQRDLKNIYDKYHLNGKDIMYYLNAHIAREVLLDRYMKMVGEGDFYCREEAKKIIREKVKSTTMQNRLIRTLQLIAQARHVDVARRQFVEGTQIKGEYGYMITGSNKTFQSYLGKLQKLGINPVLITDDLRKRTGYTHLLNPICQIKKGWTGYV